jgi:hypothetical protein
MGWFDYRWGTITSFLFGRDHWSVWNAHLLSGQILVAQLEVIIKQEQYGVN